MTTILLNAPVPMSDRLERLKLFPGRHLGEDELDRMQAYADERLAPLLAAARPGIVRGLELDLAPPPVPGSGAAGQGLAVRPGLAVAGNGHLVGLFYEARATWRALVEAWLAETRASDAAGVYYLVVRRFTGLVDADLGLDPCRRAEPDPRRDTRIETMGSLALRRLALSAEAIALMTPAQVQNQVAALNLDGAFLGTLGSAVPLALLAVSSLGPPPEDPDVFGYRVDWVSQAAGRYLAIPDSGAQVLLAQVQAAFREALSEALLPPADPDADPVPIPDRLEQTLRLDFLPAAGVLPSVLLQDPESRTPRLRWLPPHLGADMVPVPEESVAELIERHLPRRAIDLRQPAGERIRLLLAVNEPDYRPDLLDFPEIDAVLTSDLHRYYTRAYQAWLDWRIDFDRLYRLLGTEILTPAEVRALALPAALAPPEPPADFYARLIAAATRDLPPDGEGPPYPYSEGPPPPPQLYRDWLVPNPADPEGPRIPPPVPIPADNGLVIRYRLTQLEMEGLDSQIRSLRSRLEKTRDYLLLQRQQLDAQTVSLAALGGGVAGDGAGLQVARWLPFTQLKLGTATAPGPAPEAQALGGGEAASVFVGGTDLREIRLAQTKPTFELKEPATATFGTVSLSAASASAAVTGIKGSMASSVAARARASSVELGLQKDRLDRLAEIPKQTLTKPAVQGRTFQFGVLDHIQPEVREYEAAYRGMRDLIATLSGLFDPPEAEEIRRALEAIGVPVSPQTLHGNKPPLGFYDLARLRQFSDSNPERPEVAGFVTAMIGEYRRVRTALNLPADPTESDAAGETNERFEALFKAGKILAGQIAYMESRYNRREDELESKLRGRIRLESALDKLAAQIEETARRLQGLDGRRVERLGDYGVAQALAREDWARVYREDRERTRVLTQGLRGLYYVRVREAPVSLSLTDPLALRHGAAGDPVPGCDWSTEVDVPPVLADFFAAVLEVPMGDWTALAPLVPRLPVERIPDLLGQRRYRFGQRRGGGSFGATALSASVGAAFQGGRTAALVSNAGGGLDWAGAQASAGLSQRLAPLAVATQGVYRTWSVFEVSASQASLSGYLRESSRVLSLQDLLGGLSGPVQREAQALHNRLEQCVVCLMDRLGTLQPSLRFQWAQLAEDDRLDTERPETWPGLERAEAEDFNATRTVAELVAWWFRQLDRSASGAARGALRNLIRAAHIVAAHGDPNEIVKGQVLTPPRILAVGEALRLTLNRAPLPGTRLQILDDAQRVVGLLAVQDQDERGTLAQVVRVDDASVRVSTRFTVVASRATRQLS